MVYSLVLFVPLLSLCQELWSFFKHGGSLILAIQIWPRIGRTWQESRSLSREPVRLPFFAESNVTNERRSANEGDEGNEHNETQCLSFPVHEGDEGDEGNEGDENS